MWIKSYSKTYQNVTKEAVWAAWADVNNRHLWDIDTEWAKLDGPFNLGAIFYMKPKGGPKIKMHITETTVNKSFTDTWKLPFARLDGIHTMESTPEGLKLTTSIKITGLFSWFLRKIFGEKIVLELPSQTDALVELARKNS